MTFTASLADIVAENPNGLLGAKAHWDRIRLQDVATIVNGFPFESARFTKDRGTPLIRIRDIVGGSTGTYYDGDYDPSFLVLEGDLLVGMDGDFNCGIWPGPPALLNQRTCKIVPDETRYDRRFLRHVLPGYLSAINADTPSLTVKHLSSRTIADIPLPLPSLGEQRAVADELDKQFSRLDAGIAALKRVQDNLKRYRAAVLKAACEGRLVPTEAELARQEGRKYETGAQLLERLLAERRAKWQGRGKYQEPAGPDTAGLADLPEGWVWATVEQLNLANRPCAYGVLQPGHDVNDGVQFVRVGDISDGRVMVTNLKRIAQSVANQYPRTRLQGGELVITLVGAIGRTAIVPESLAGANTARAVGVVPLSSIVVARWVELWFRNPIKVQEMDGKSHEVARKTLNLEDVRAALVALPPHSEQWRIVAEAEHRLTGAAVTEAAVEANLRRAGRLRQAVLGRIFR